MRRRLEGSVIVSRPALILRAAMRGVQRGVEIVRNGEARVISLRASRRSERTALVSYSIAPFLGRTAPPDKDPAASWVSATLARCLVERGWAVDVVSDRNARFIPSRPYGVTIATRRSLGALAPRLPSGCLKVLFLDAADALFQHAAECGRLLELKDRRGVVLSQRRYEPVTPVLEQADCAIVQGNEFTLETYRHARSPLHRVSAPSPDEPVSPAGKDIERCRRSFLWLSGRGFVHQGLDRTLEAFAWLPHLRLCVAAPVHDDPDFTEAYRRELHETPNIHLVAPPSMPGARVGALAADGIAVVLPSCAEGQATEVVAGMAAGLIPIVTRESGVDVGDFGIVLQDASVETIAAAVRAVSELPAARLRQMAAAAREFARARHGVAALGRRYDEILSAIVPPA